MQGLLNLHSSPRYLEIGVYEGHTLRALAAAQKVAVDPHFSFDLVEARSADPSSTFHEVTSDEYFGRVAAANAEFEVIFLDGLHTFEQTLRDLISALSLLAPGGAIVIDDITPSSHLAALRDERRFQALRQILDVKRGAWMGDVYRLVYFIDSFCQQMTYRTVGETEAQLVLWKQARESVVERDMGAIARMTYDDMLFERETYRIAPFETILDELRAAGAGV